MKYDILSDVLPPMPKRLPGFVNHTISKVPEFMRPAAAQALFPAATAQMHDVYFRYIDNVLNEPGSKMELCIAPSSFGKGYLSNMNEAIIRFLREHDKESERKLLEWQRIYNTKGDNKDKPERPLDAATLVPLTNMTSASLLQLSQDAEREGNRSLFSNLPELDMLDQCYGGHKGVTTLLRLNYDTDYIGAQRASAKGVFGKARLRWKIFASTTIENAQDFFRGKAMTDGTLGRIGISLLRSQDKVYGKRFKQGDYNKEYYDKLDEYLVRLRAANGEIKVPNIDKIVNRLSAEIGEMYALSDDHVFSGFAIRSLKNAWLKCCVIYVAEGYKWSQEIANFLEWSFAYDLWSKIQSFTASLQARKKVHTVDVRRHGPGSILDFLPMSFSKDQLEELRISLGKDSAASNLISTWMTRKWIAYDATKQLYTKTEDYLAKHPANT